MRALSAGSVPAARSAVVPAYLDDPRTLRVTRRDPVEAVSSEVHDLAAAAKVGLKRIEPLPRPVLRMTARDDGAIAREKRQTLLVDILIRRDVIVDADPLEPLEHEQVLREVAPGVGQPVGIARPHIHQRTTPRGVAHGRAIRMRVVARAPKFRVLVQVLLVGGHHELVRHDLTEGCLQCGKPVISVCQVRVRGEQEEHARLLIARREHEEGIAINVPTALEADAVHPAGQALLRQRELKVIRPVRVDHVVLVELDGAVLRRCIHERVMATGPVPARDPTISPIHDDPGGLTRRGLGDCLSLRIDGEVPRADNRCSGTAALVQVSKICR